MAFRTKWRKHKLLAVLPLVHTFMCRQQLKVQQRPPSHELHELRLELEEMRARAESAEARAEGAKAALQAIAKALAFI